MSCTVARIRELCMLNLYVGWVGVLVGCVFGAIQGMFFHGEEWLGGYGSWRRRLTRLGHVSFFGIGFINIMFGLSVRSLGLEEGVGVSSVLLVVGAVTMPLLCYVSAFKEVFRNLFFVPAVSVMAGIGLFVWRMLTG